MITWGDLVQDFADFDIALVWSNCEAGVRDGLNLIDYARNYSVVRVTNVCHTDA